MCNSKMSEEKVKAIAKLVNLDLSVAEVESYRESIPQTLAVIDVLKELETSQVLPTSQVTALHSVYLPADQPATTLSQELALSNASETARGLFVTQAVFDRT